MKYCGRPCHDQDYCVCGLTKETFEQIFPMAHKRGKSFGVYEIEQQEYALARREHKCAEGHRGFTVQTDPSISIEEDLARRDLTVNAIAKDLENNTYLDPYGGREDLKHGVLRAIGPSFAEDPLRVYRVARLAATLSFTVEPGTLQMMQKLKTELKSLSKERVMTEFQKALLSPSPRIFFDVLKTAQVLDVHFPEIQALVDVPQPEQYHPEGDAYQHTMLALQSAVSLTQQPEIRYAVLVHDFGKGKTPSQEYPHHIDHEKRGVEEVEKLSQRLGVPKRWKKCGKMAALFHGKAGIFSQMRVAKQVDFLDMLSRSTLGLDGMEIVAQADQMGKKQEKREINLAHVGHQMLEQVKGKTIAQEHLDWPDTKRKEKIREERIRWLSAYDASQRRENPMNRKSEKGSIVVYVLVTMVIFTIICIGVFVRSTSKQQLQLETLGRLENVYQGDQTAQEAYQQYVGGDVIPIYTADQFYQIASGSTLNIQDKNYTMSKGKTYYLQQDIELTKDVSSILKMAQNHEIEIIGQGHMVSSTVNGTTYVYLEEDQWEKETLLTVGQTGKILDGTSNTILRDKNRHKIVLPAGFQVVNLDDLTVEKGIVVEDQKKNQYVWIPCTEATYQRDTSWYIENDNSTLASKDELTLADAKCSTSDANDGLTDAKLAEIVAQVKAEKASVNQNGGYYIGRYEVGGSAGAEVIQANQTPRTGINWSTAYGIAKGIGGGTGATTYLCSSYAWDTAIHFIQNNGFPNYATAREDSYNENWLDKNVTDATGNIIKKAGSQTRLATGKTTPKCNIYDMGGNVEEFTTEVNPNSNDTSTSEPLVVHGGNYYGTNDTPAGLRTDHVASSAYIYRGLRATLFLK